MRLRVKGVLPSKAEAGMKDSKVEEPQEGRQLAEERLPGDICT